MKSRTNVSVCMEYVTGNANDEDDEAGGGGVGVVLWFLVTVALSPSVETSHHKKGANKGKSL